MSRLSDPVYMLRATSALFGAIFLPVGVSFFFVLGHRHWPEGIVCVAAAVGFFYVAWRADAILGLDEIQNTADIVLPEPGPPAPAVRSDDSPPEQESSP